MENFTPISALIGGALIGISSTLFLWLNGRITGISGIAGGLNTLNKEDVTWRLMFLLGLIVGVLLYRKSGGPLADIEINKSITLLILSGLLTGIGTKMGRGCTSGHGICGIARFSLPSIVSVLIFLGIAFITVFFTRHVVGALF
mgnify:CR=1 FL=1